MKMSIELSNFIQIKKVQLIAHLLGIKKKERNMKAFRIDLIGVRNSRYSVFDIEQMRFDSIISMVASEGWYCVVYCASPMLAPHLPKKTSWRKKKMRSLMMSWKKKRNCIYDDGGGFCHVI